MYDGSIYGYMDKERELYESYITVGLTNTGIVVHRREDLIASPLDVIIRTNAAEHWRQSQLRPGIMASIPKTLIENVLIERVNNYPRIHNYVKTNMSHILESL